MAVDWRHLRPKPGEWVCPRHGIIEPVAGPVVPFCGDCLRMALEAVQRRGLIVYREPAPACCAGPDRHPFGPRLVSLSWLGCRCRAGGHATWRCRRCPDVQMWPPHDPAVATR